MSDYHQTSGPHYERLAKKLREQNAKAQSELASATGSAAGNKLSDGTEILRDESTATTRWVLYRHGQTGTLNLAIVQGKNKVTVSIANLHYLFDKWFDGGKPQNMGAETRPQKP